MEKLDSITELNQIEILIIEGGSFARDLGKSIRFMCIFGSYGGSPTGYLKASFDYAMNEAKCGC